MRSLERIIADNGNDNTPALDTANLTGRVKCEFCGDIGVAMADCKNENLCVRCHELYTYTREGIAYNE
jgi:hypothetical protein